MKRLIVFGALLAILAPGIFDIADAAHKVNSIDQSSGVPGATVITIIRGEGFTANPTTLSFVPPSPRFPGEITITQSGSINLAQTEIPVTIVISATAVKETKTIQVIIGDSKTVNFTVGTVGVGAGGFIEAVPAKYGGIPEGPQTGGDFILVVEGITDWLFVILLVIAVVFIVLAGFQFIVGGGDPQAVAQARQKLIWAAASRSFLFLRLPH